MMGVQDLRSTVHRPFANAAIERVHRTINAVFAKTIKEHQRDWYEQAKYVCFAYNTAEHTSTTFSSFFLVFLREPRVGIDLILGRSELGYQTTDEYSEKVQERMQTAYRTVSEQLKVTFDRAKHRYDQRVHAVHFPLNSYVWYFFPRLTAGRGRKFRRLTGGPFRVVRILNDVNYVIQKVPGSRLIICHVDQLIRYDEDPPGAWRRYDKKKSQSRTVTAITSDSTEVPDFTDSSVKQNGRSVKSDSFGPTVRKQTRALKSGSRSRDHDKMHIRNKGPRNYRKTITVLQTGCVSDLYRNADNRPITRLA